MQFFKNVLLFVLATVLVTFSVNAQDSTHITWKIEAKKIESGKYELQYTGTISKGWYVYPSASPADDLEGVVVTDEDSSTAYNNRVFLSKANTIKDVIFEKDMAVTSEEVKFTENLIVQSEVPAQVKITLNYIVADGATLIPETQNVVVTLDASKVSTVSNRILIPTIDLQNPLTDCGASSSSSVSNTESKGYFSIFFLGFLGGLVALILPCLFPMIPLTVSFFTKKATSKKVGIRNAFLYGFFIFLIYVLISLPFHFIESLSPDILNNISTNPYLNVAFFAIFIFFAFSFFGFYEITLPASFSSKADSKAGAGNIVGIFFMALTLALVSFSCTGPILGSLLAGSLSGSGGAMRLSFGMGGFGLALALPFALFALFPNWLNSLPKSGGWLNSVKVFFGFIEFALAFKFLSNADLVMHWGILKREVFIGIWILVCAGLTLYLFGLIKFKHDSPIKKLSTGRKILGLIFGLFTLYLVPGVTNTKYANLSLISGFPPPLYYSIYKTGNDCVLDLNCTRDYEEGLKLAKEQNKPILIDFTGYACVNCRKMEENVWSQPAVYALMKDKFIVISLYVDDKKKLPLDQQFTYTSKDGSKKEIITVGDKWSTFETENFKNNAQPLYAILNTNEELLSHPVGYVHSEKEYLAWLQCGVDTFYKK